MGEKLMDPEGSNRKPSTIKEHIESAIPDLRKNVPEKRPTPHRQIQRKPPA
jgi:hypothetical protein